MGEEPACKQAALNALAGCLCQDGPTLLLLLAA